MSSLIKARSRFDLRSLGRDEVVAAFKKRLMGRVREAYLFGSFSTGEHESSSDIDIILVVDTSQPFTERGMAFGDLYEVYPALDILVYTPEEFASQLKHEQGFWGSVKESLYRFI